MGKTIKFYTTKEGKCPVEEYLDSLSDKVAKKITWVLTLIEEFEKLPSLYFKKLKGTDDIWECRIQYGSSSHRILGFFFTGELVVLTHGFSKKSRKTPTREIKRAESYKRDFERRYHE